MIKLYKNFEQIVTLESALKKDGRHIRPEDLSIIPHSSIVFDNDKILWLGHTKAIPKEYQNITPEDFTGHVLTPEIVDSHTHLVFGGDRAFEYSMRLNGADYQDIAHAGGGILSTVGKTATMGESELFELAKKRVESIHAYGVGTIEIKSGYGLTYESEMKISHVIQRLKEHFVGKVQIFNTFLAAHAVPAEFKSSNHYLNEVVLPLLDELGQKNILDFVDIFYEEGYFDREDSQILFERAKNYGLKIKIHADEFSNSKGAQLAANYKAISADHLLCTQKEGAKALAESGTVATLLPGTAYFLGKPLANARLFIEQGCKVALASDYNPGSCHCDNLLLIASLSAKSLGLNIAQLWSAITLNAAHALDLRNQGSLIKGFAPRFSIFKCNSIDEVTYNWGKNLAQHSD